MTTKLFYIFIVISVLTSCNNIKQKKETSKIDNIKIYQNSSSNNQNDQSEIIEINCDSIYKDKGIKIKLIWLGKNNMSEPNYKYIFLVTKRQNDKYSEIYRDTIESRVQEVTFSDFNNDKIKDILIQNNSDVRSNWTYNLYLVDRNVEQIIKIKGFGEIKNPNYLPKYDLIDNYVMSGQNWTSFYKIVGDSIKDFGIEIYEGKDDKGRNNYDKEYKNAINKIMKKEKNNR